MKASLKQRKFIACVPAEAWCRRQSSLQSSVKRRKKDELMQKGAVRNKLLADPSQLWNRRSSKTDLKHLDFVHRTTKDGLWLDSWSVPTRLEAQVGRLRNTYSAGAASVRVDGGPAGDHVHSFRAARAESPSGAWSSFYKEGQVDEAIQALDLMHREGCVVSVDLLYQLLKWCIAQKDQAAGRRVHAISVRNGHEANAFLGNHIIRMYASHGELQKASEVFCKLQPPNVFAWSAIISAHVDHGKAMRAIELYRQLRQTPVRPDDYIFVAVLKACASLSDLTSGRLVHGDVVNNGSQSNVFVGNTLVHMYSKCGSLEDARTVFDKLQTRDVVTWNAMIAGYSLHGNWEEAFKLYREMQEQSFTPDDVTFVTILKACASMGDVQIGRQAHMDIVTRGEVAHGSIRTALVDMYAKCQCLEEARAVFDSMLTKDGPIWSAMISGYAQHGSGEEALRLYSKMRHDGITAEKATLVHVLKVCGNIGCILDGKAVHSDIMEMRLEADVFVGSALIDMYCKCGAVVDAQAVFDGLPTRDIAVWNTMISGYAQQGLGKEALDVYHRMLQEGMTPDKLTFVSVLKACGSVGAIQEGKWIHAQVLKSGLQVDLFVGSTLMDMYAKCGNLDDAHKVFDSLPRRNVVTWNIMIAAYGQHGLGDKALKLYTTMQHDGIVPDKVTFVSSLRACGSTKAIQIGKQIHTQIVEKALESDLFVGSALMDMYAKCGCLSDARKVFNSLRTRDVVTWNIICAAYVQHGLGRDAIQLFQSMQLDDITPDQTTFVTVLKACASAGVIQEGQRIHSQIVGRGLEADTLVGNSLIDMYTTCGSLEEARQVFETLPAKDAVTWSVMIAGYAQNGLGQEALALNRRMQQSGVIPNNSVGFGGILKACCSVGALQEGRRTHAQILEQGLEENVFVASTLVDMYVRCGNLEDAQTVFDSLPCKDVVAWTALINGYGQHHDWKTALELFEKMQQQGVEPDSATFTSLLSSCSHLGLVEEGQKHFRMMRDCHGITQTVEHYTAMVDLLGRAGLFDEAQSLLGSIPLSGLGAAWRALLSACRKFGNVERGRLCFNRLVEMEPEQAAAYVLMSSIYEDAGRWEDVDVVKKMRKRAGANKKPALASIQVDGKVHEFIVGDTGFQQADDVYSKLRSLNERMKGEGHVAHTGPLLDPVSEAEKEEALCGHAEKLAIAYGLLNTPAGTPLLVVKNLRMCQHCHNGSKFISRTEGREIVVRDAHCVHHFKDGFCSCGDQ